MPDPKPLERRRQLAVFLDFENLAIGFRGQPNRFEISRVLTRLVEKGNIVVKRAYADWKRFQSYVSALHEAAFELIEIPVRRMTGKNSADIRLCVDAMDLCHSKDHIDTFVIVSGDSDFSPLVSKLKENGKYLIGLGTQASTSDLLRDNCDEFIYYEDLLAGTHSLELGEADEKKRKVFQLLLESLQALRRENRDILWCSMVKETMQRKRPSFNEGYYGYKSFSKLLEDAQSQGLVELIRDDADKTYIVKRFGEELKNGEPAKPATVATSKTEESAPKPASDRDRPRRRRRRSPRSARPAEQPAASAASTPTSEPQSAAPAPEAEPAKVEAAPPPTPEPAQPKPEVTPTPAATEAPAKPAAAKAPRARKTAVKKKKKTTPSRATKPADAEKKPAAKTRRRAPAKKTTTKKTASKS